MLIINHFENKDINSNSKKHRRGFFLVCDANGVSSFINNHISYLFIFFKYIFVVKRINVESRCIANEVRVVSSNLKVIDCLIYNVVTCVFHLHIESRSGFDD